MEGNRATREPGCARAREPVQMAMNRTLHAALAGSSSNESESKTESP